MWQISTGGVVKVAHANHELARARMAREAEALGAVGSPAVPQLVAHGVLDDGRAWIEMERIEGQNLGDLLAEGPRGALRIDHVVALAMRILQALARIHAAGFAHRDLKPDNIVRREDGSLAILDLGLARKIPEDLDDPNRAGVQVGSVEYMAPEQQLDATTAGAAADLYAFGCILYELCSGRPPFVGDAAALERAHAALRPPPLGGLVAVPSLLEELTHELLAKQPQRRPASIGDILARLRTVQELSGGPRAQRSMSVIGSGKQPVVLLWAELPRVDRTLMATLAARKVAIVSARGRRVLGGIAGIEHADPAGAAIAAARDLAAAGARVALHLDAVTVTHGPKLALSGPSIAKPETWLPEGPWTGVVLTRAFATVAQVPTYASELGPMFAQLGDAGKTDDELFGRDVLVADIATEAAAALGGFGPGLTLLVGEHGIGKTAIARALRTPLDELGARVVFGTVPAPGSGKPGYTALGELVGTPKPGAIVREIGDALRAAARERPTAVVLDELHLAEHELLDALEYATLGGEPLPLWVLGLAAPRFDQRRPSFGERAERPRRIVVPPLDDAASVAMIAAHLRPAEYPPLRALRQIAAIARGNPMHIATLAREIHDRGAIRTRPGGEHFLDTTALDALPPLALGPWLAARELAGLGPELVSLARVCAILGDELDRDELGAVIQIAEHHGSATTTVDLDVGLAELETHRILVSGRGTWAFPQSLLEEGIYATTDEAERRALHAAALEYWRARSDRPGADERIARHAEAVGESRVAAAAFAALGARAHDAHRSLDADQAWQGAVRNLHDRDLDRGRALLGRARARYRLQRVRDALIDLDEVIAIATTVGDPALEISALVEKSTALDWVDDFETSSAVASRARSRLEAVDDPMLALDVELAEGRSLFRRQQFDEAVPHLRAVMARASEQVRTEVETIARVLLAPALVEIGALDDAERVFADLISLCETRDDRLHLGAAYANRAWLWSKRGAVERTADDLRVVIQLAREIGQATLERIATYNLAEDRLWQGALDEAVQLARRSLALQRGHGEGDDNLDLLLLGRVLAAREELRELGEVISMIDRETVSPSDRLVLAVLECASEERDAGDWSSAFGATRELGSDLRLELGYLVARSGALDPSTRDELRELAHQHPIWSRRTDL